MFRRLETKFSKTDIKTMTKSVIIPWATKSIEDELVKRFRKIAEEFAEEVVSHYKLEAVFKEEIKGELGKDFIILLQMKRKK